MHTSSLFYAWSVYCVTKKIPKQKRFYVSIVCCLVYKCSNKNLMVWSSFSACHVHLVHLLGFNEQPTHVKCISHTSLQVSSLVLLYFLMHVVF